MKHGHHEDNRVKSLEKGRSWDPAILPYNIPIAVDCVSREISCRRSPHPFGSRITQSLFVFLLYNRSHAKEKSP